MISLAKVETSWKLIDEEIHLMKKDEITEDLLLWSQSLSRLNIWYSFTFNFDNYRGYGDKPSFTSHKSMSCMGEVGEDAGLISHEAGHGHGAASPAHHRKSLHNIKKSFSLKQKKSFTGPLYVDIDSQGKH